MEGDEKVKAKLRWGFMLLLAGIFVTAGVLKAVAPQRFFQDVQNYKLLPWNGLVVGVAFYLPWLEIISGIALFVRSLRVGALLLISTMLFSFTLALSLAWGRGLDISCGCFGRMTGPPHYLLWIGRDSGLLMISVALTITEMHRNRRREGAFDSN